MRIGVVREQLMTAPPLAVDCVLQQLLALSALLQEVLVAVLLVSQIPRTVAVARTPLLVILTAALILIAGLAGRPAMHTAAAVHALVLQVILVLFAFHVLREKCPRVINTDFGSFCCLSLVIVEEKYYSNSSFYFYFCK